MIKKNSPIIKFDFTLTEFDAILRLVRWELEDSQWCEDHAMIEHLYSQLKDRRDRVTD